MLAGIPSNFEILFCYQLIHIEGFSNNVTTDTDKDVMNYKVLRYISLLYLYR